MDIAFIGHALLLVPLTIPFSILGREVFLFQHSFTARHSRSNSFSHSAFLRICRGIICLLICPWCPWITCFFFQPGDKKLLVDGDCPLIPCIPLWFGILPFQKALRRCWLNRWWRIGGNIISVTDKIHLICLCSYPGTLNIKCLISFLLNIFLGNIGTVDFFSKGL